MHATWLVGVLLAAPAVVAAGDVEAAKGPGVGEILSQLGANNRARAAALRQYTSARRYILRNARFGTNARLEVQLFYRAPGSKEFRVTGRAGSRLIGDRVLKRLIRAELEAARPEVQAATEITPANYDFKLLASETRGARRCYVLQADPKVPNKFLFRGRVWVDAEDFAVSRIEGSPAVRPSFWTRKTTFVHEYAKLGEFWLPVSNRSTTEVRIFGRTEVAVEYWGYQINTPESGKEGVGGSETITLDGVGTASDDWRAPGPRGK